MNAFSHEVIPAQKLAYVHVKARNGSLCRENKLFCTILVSTVVFTLLVYLSDKIYLCYKINIYLKYNNDRPIATD